MSFAKLVLWIAAANYFCAGSYALVLPVENASLIQLEPGGVVALADLRCVYGGLRIGIGLFLGWLAFSGQVRLELVGAGWEEQPTDYVPLIARFQASATFED